VILEIFTRPDLRMYSVSPRSPSWKMMLFLGKLFSWVMPAMRSRLSWPTPEKIETRCKKTRLFPIRGDLP